MGEGEGEGIMMEEWAEVVGMGGGGGVCWANVARAPTSPLPWLLALPPLLRFSI